jgi:predicted AAA+ superfamily ATPase
MPAYRPRIVDAELLDQLQSAGAVVIDGPKACGKTMTATQQAASRVLLDVPGPGCWMNGRWNLGCGIR